MRGGPGERVDKYLDQPPREEDCDEKSEDIQGETCDFRGPSKIPVRRQEVDSTSAIGGQTGETGPEFVGMKDLEGAPP